MEAALTGLSHYPPPPPPSPPSSRYPVSAPSRPPRFARSKGLPPLEPCVPARTLRAKRNLSRTVQHRRRHGACQEELGIPHAPHEGLSPLGLPTLPIAVRRSASPHPALRGLCPRTPDSSRRGPDCASLTRPVEPCGQVTVARRRSLGLAPQCTTGRLGI